MTKSNRKSKDDCNLLKVIPVRSLTIEWTKFKRCLIKCAQLIRSMKLTIDEVMKGKGFPQIPNSHGELFVKFLDRVKSSDYDEVQKLLLKNKYLVFDYDTLI